MPLEMLMLQTPLSIAAADVTGRLTFCSPALQRMLQRPFKQLTLTEMVAEYDLYACDGVTPLRTEDIPLTQALLGEPATEAVIATKLVGGSLRFLRCTASPLRSAESQVVGAVVLVADVTAERTAQMEQNELRRQYFDAVNHELRTPLAKIRGYAELLHDDPDTPPDRTRQALDVIIRATEDLERFAVVLSELSEQENDACLVRTHSNIAQVVANTAEAMAMRTAAAAAATSLDPVVVGPDQVTATIDPDLVTCAVTALVDNAVTYAPPDSTVMGEVSKFDDHVEIGARDAGKRIHPPELPRLVRPSESGDHPLQPVNGRGRGLALAQIVTNAHDGELLFSSQQPSGWSATIRLPRYNRDNGAHR